MIFLTVLLTVFFLCLVFRFLFSEGFGRKNIFDEEKGKSGINLPVAEEKSIVSVDGTRLKGYFYPKGKSLVILLHGYRGNHRQMLPFADYYYNELGCSVLVPDLRCHGESGGKYISFGCLEREDTVCWIEYIKEMMGENTPVFLHGVSMGAATALMTASVSRVCGVISDCSYANGAEIIKKQIKKEYHLPPEPLFFFADKMMKLKCGHSLYETDVCSYVKEIRCPVLYIHGEKDDFISSAGVYKLYDHTNSEKNLWICDGAGHCESALKNRDAYSDRVKGFLSGISGGQTA